jgi:hypothetical protein
MSPGFGWGFFLPVTGAVLRPGSTRMIMTSLADQRGCEAGKGSRR